MTAARRVAATLWVISVVAMLGAIGFFAVVGAPGGVYGNEPAFGFAFPAVGALIARRYPRNAVGWLLLGTGTLGALGLAVTEFAFWAMAHWSGAPGLAWCAWPEQWYWIPAMAMLVTFLPLLFPDGRPVGPRWRWLVWATAAMLAYTVGTAMLMGPPLVEFPGLDNPLGAGLSSNVVGFGLVGLVLCAIGSVTSLAVRYRRSSETVRQQLKWMVLAGVLTVIQTAITILGPATAGQIPAWSVALQFVAVSSVPVSIGVAITRYRLYDIDRIISRTVSYVVVTGVLVGVYVGCIAIATAVIGGSSSIRIAAATLAAAAAFQPLRHRVQSAVDRRFNRARYDAARTVDAFSARLRSEVEIPTITADLVDVVRRTVAPSSASLWLRGVS